MLHHTGSTAPAINQAQYLADNDRDVSCGYVVGYDWTVYQLADDDRCTRHAGTWSYEWLVNNMNLHSIGIEICSNGTDYTAGQRVAVRNLVNDLIRKYDIPVTNIIRHLDYAPKRKRDVWDNFWNNEHATREDYQQSYIQKEPLIQEAIDKWYYNGIEGDGVTDRSVLLTMKAIDWELNDIMSHLSYSNDNDAQLSTKTSQRQGEDQPNIDWENVSGAELEIDLRDLKILKTAQDVQRENIPRHFGDSLLNFLEDNKEKALDQDEFGIDNLCTFYGNLNVRMHYNQEARSKSDRRREVEYWIEKWYIDPTKWGNGFKNATRFGERNTASQYYLVELNSRAMVEILQRNHAIAFGWTVSQDFIKDRKDLKIDKWHGGKTYSDHWAMMHWYGMTKDDWVVVINSYKNRKDSSFDVPKESRDVFFDDKYVVKYGILALYT